MRARASVPKHGNAFDTDDAGFFDAAEAALRAAEAALCAAGFFGEAAAALLAAAAALLAAGFFFVAAGALETDDDVLVAMTLRGDSEPRAPGGPPRR